MNNRKSILFICLSTLGIIILYNYMFVPMLMPKSTRMGMGMHGRVYNTTNYLADFRFALLIIIIILGMILLIELKSSAKLVRCTKCKAEIQNHRWVICPFCGTQTNNMKG